jgi:signal transduction histidine kinase
MPNGSVKYVRTIAHGNRGTDGRPEIIGAVQDVTERRLAEEALSQARSDLAHVTRVTSLGMLTASIAHEVNQPLSGIITNAGTCLRMLAAEPPNVEGARETAKRTIRDSNRASELLTRLRALFSKKESTTESVDLNEAAQEVIERTSAKPGDSPAGIRRRPLGGDRGPRPASAGDLESAQERLGRHERRERSSKAVADQNGTKHRRSGAAHRTGCGRRP